MDIVINKYLDNLAPYAITLESINNMYNMNLEPYETFEYYAQKIQTELDLSDEYEDDEELKREFDPNNTHNTWRESDIIDEKTILEFTKNLVDNSSKGKIDDYLSSILLNLKEENTLPWNLYLKKIIGTIEADKKKTITRRNRRQPNRLDLRGEIRRHIAKIIVAIDISASISDEEFNQAIKEIFSIIKNYKYEITIVECDDKIRRVYKVKSQRDVKERLKIRGATKFNEVFEYANLNKANLLIYFTDGKGEEKLQTKPIGYKTLWILSSRGEDLSLTKPFGIIKKLNALNLKDDSLDMNDVRNDGYSMNNQAPIL
jgi:predicted metal-dependent peptidase